MFESLFPQKGKTVDFKKLPLEIQNKLLQLQNPVSDSFFFKASISTFNWVSILLGGGWIAYLFFSTSDILWYQITLWIYSAITAIALPLLFFSLLKVTFLLFSKIKSGFIFSRDGCFKINGNLIEFWNLKEINLLMSREEEQKVEFWVGEKKETFKILNPGFAKKLENEFPGLKENASDGLLSKYLTPQFAYNDSFRFLIAAGGLLISLISGGVMVYTANRMNLNYNDDINWKQIASLNSIPEYFRYKLSHQQGAHQTEADQKITELLDKLSKENQSKPESNPKAAAINGLKAFLEEVVKGSDKTVYIKITEFNNLDNNTIGIMKTLSKLPIHSYDSVISISPEAEKKRKDKVFNDIRELFLPLMRDTDLRIENAESLPPQSPFVEVNYYLQSNVGYFGMTSGKNEIDVAFKKPDDFYPQIKCQFDLSLKSTDSSNLYQTKDAFTLENFSFKADDKHPEQTLNIVYFNKHSEQFRSDMKEHFGVF